MEQKVKDGLGKVEESVTSFSWWFEKSNLGNVEWTFWKVSSWWLEIGIFTFLIPEADDQVSRNDCKSGNQTGVEVKIIGDKEVKEMKVCG